MSKLINKKLEDLRNGLIINRCRNEQNMSLTALILGVGISLSKAQRMEKGKTHCKPHDVDKVLSELLLNRIDFDEFNKKADEIIVRTFKAYSYNLNEIEELKLEFSMLIESFGEIAKHAEKHLLFQFMNYACSKNASHNEMKVFRTLIREYSDLYSHDELSIFYDFNFIYEYSNKKYDKCEKYLKNALSNTHNDEILSLIYYHYGSLKFKELNYYNAIKYYEIALDLFLKLENNSKKVYTSFSLAANYALINECKMALNEFENCLEKAICYKMPDAFIASIHRNIAYIYLEQQNYKLVIKDAKKSIEFDDKNSATYFALSYALYKIGQIDDLKEYIKLGIQKSSEHDLNYEYLLLIKKMDKDYKGSIDTMMKVYNLKCYYPRDARIIILDMIIEYYEEIKDYKNMSFYQHELINQLRYSKR